MLATSLPIAATPNPAASGTLNAKPSEGGLRQKCRRRSSPVVDRQGQQRQCLGVQPRRQDTEGCSPRRVHRQEAIVCPHPLRSPTQQLPPRKRKRCGASRRRYKSSHKLPSGKKLSAIELIQALRRGRGTGGKLDWDIPSVDLEEWKTTLTAPEVKIAEAQMKRISRKIFTTKHGPIAGHWSRHERQHRRLLSLYPRNPYVQMVGDGISFTMSGIPEQPRLPRPKLQRRDLRILTLCVLNWLTMGLAKPITKSKWQQHLQG